MHTHLPSRTRTTLSLLLPVLLLAACGRESSTPAASREQADDTQLEATATLGDARIRASVVPTQRIGEAVARQYGITREPGTVLLLVGIRRGPEADESALPARVTATAHDLRGVGQTLSMQEVRNGELIDYTGTAQVLPPDSLRFNIDVQLEGGERTTLQFSRDIYPE
jgi:hypothetical protein